MPSNVVRTYFKKQRTGPLFSRGTARGGDVTRDIMRATANDIAAAFIKEASPAGGEGPAIGGGCEGCVRHAGRRAGSSSAQASQPSEEEVSVRLDGLLRCVNSLHSAFESAHVHAFWLWDIIAHSGLAADFPA